MRIHYGFNPSVSKGDMGPYFQFYRGPYSRNGVVENSL